MRDQIAQRIAQTRQILGRLDFDRERCNERSALVLLALLHLTPEMEWSEATNPMLRTVEIMEWIRTRYGKDYKPNTRETIRRFTLHQFAEGLLVVQNPDMPHRPINSPRWCYQVSKRALDLLRTVEGATFDEKLQAYLHDIPSLREQFAKAREMNRIPVNLPDGAEVTLSPGGQNILLKQMIEDFCSMFTPGGKVLYVGDAGEKYAVFNADELASLGVGIEERGKMPDLVVYMADKNWLLLLEAASSHGPVDATRYSELSILFAGSTAALVYVSCFPSREEMRRFLPQIAWETDVWCADHPTHLIHFNGEGLLGSYSESRE